MFGYVIDLHDVRRALRQTFDRQAGALAGAAFLIMALAAIQYDEIVAPSVGRISDAWGSIAMDFGRKLSSFAP